MATLTVYADSADGQIYSTDATYSTARTGAGLAASGVGTVLTVGQQTGYYLYESFVSFDTSSIVDTATVTAADLSLVVAGSGLNTNFTCEARLKNWGAGVTTADWVAGGSLSALTRVATKTSASGATTGTRYSFTEDGTNFVNNVSLTGTTYLILVSDRLVAGNAPTNNEYISWKSSETAGTTDDPKLVVTYTAVVAVSVAGNQPAATGTVANKRFKALAGAQAAPSGAVTIDRLLQHKSLAGNQPAASGTVASLRTSYKTLAGNQPAASGSLTYDFILQHVALAGNQAAPSGALADITIIPGITTVTVAGNQPSATGALARLQLLKRSLAGNQPAPSGSLTYDILLRHKTLTGNQPASTGAVAIRWLYRQILLAGNQPSATGTVGAVSAKFVDLAGNQPNATGVVSGRIILQHANLAGDQPSATGVLSAHFVFVQVSLAGNQPNATGRIGILQAVALAGNQPYATGVVVVLAVTKDYTPSPHIASARRSSPDAPARGTASDLRPGVGSIGLQLRPGPGSARLRP